MVYNKPGMDTERCLLKSRKELNHMKEHTCCFTGHRIIPNAELPIIKQRLEFTMSKLINQGVVYYGCGGAIGFDTLAGLTVLDFKKKHTEVKLIMVLPCRNQDAHWSEKHRVAYQKLLRCADKIVCVSEQYHDSCMKKRNLHLVEHSGFCIAYLTRENSGTGQTVKLANERGLVVFHLSKEQQ